MRIIRAHVDSGRSFGRQAPGSPEENKAAGAFHVEYVIGFLFLSDRLGSQITQLLYSASDMYQPHHTAHGRFQKTPSTALWVLEDGKNFAPSGQAAVRLFTDDVRFLALHNVLGRFLVCQDPKSAPSAET